MIRELMYVTYAINLAQKELERWSNVRRQGATYSTTYSTAIISRIHSDLAVLLYRGTIFKDHSVAVEARKHIEKVYNLMAKSALKLGR